MIKQPISNIVNMYKKINWFLFIALALGLLILRLPSFKLPLDTDSSANAFFARHMLRGEILYDKFHPGHHLPGIYYTFLLAFRLFGDNPLAPKYLIIPWVLACAWLMYRMGHSFFGEFSGILGAVFFILVSSQRWVAGQTVEMEHFANLPLIAGIYVDILLLYKKAADWTFISVGILGAISILYKVTFVAPLIVAGVSILAATWIMRNEAGAWKTMISRLTWMAIGLCLPLAIVSVYFGALGLWEPFTRVFTYGFNYVNDPRQMGGSDLPRPFGFPVFWMSVNNVAFLFLGLMGTYRLIQRSLPLRNMDQVKDIVIVLWLIVTFALVGMRGGGYQHYILPAIPAIALIAGVEIQTMYWRWREASLKQYAWAGAITLTALVVANSFYSSYGLYKQYIRYMFGEISQESFVQTVEPDGYASQKIAQYLKSHTTANDFIYIWSVHVEPYYYADRLPPVDILWTSYAGATGSPTRIFSRGTKYIVLDTPKRWLRPQWLMDGLAADYDLETVIDGREIYRLRSQ